MALLAGMMAKAVIIGYGSMGRLRARHLQELDVEIEAIADPGGVPPKAAKYVYENPLEALQEHARGRMVIIASPSKEHYSQALYAMQMGCDSLLIEKPIALRAADANHLAETATHRGVFAAAAHNWRYHPGVQRAKHAITDTRGVLTIQAIDYIEEWPTVKHYGKNSYLFDDVENGGGIGWVSAVHAIDVAMYMFAAHINQAQTSLFATGRYGSTPDEIVMHTFHPLPLHPGQAGHAIIGNRWGEGHRCSTITFVSNTNNVWIDCLAPHLNDTEAMHMGLISEFVECARHGLVYVQGDEPWPGKLATLQTATIGVELIEKAEVKQAND